MASSLADLFSSFLAVQPASNTKAHSDTTLSNMADLHAIYLSFKFKELSKSKILFFNNTSYFSSA